MHRSQHVAVLMGGPSAEHAISLQSGQGVIEALTRRGWEPSPLVIPPDLTVEDAVAWTQEALRRLDPDVAFLALHGAFGEDGTVQQLCEDLHVAYTGSDVAASRLGMDKIASRQRFVRAGLSVPRWQTLALGSDAASSAEGVRYPLIVKPVNQGSSLGVTRVERAALLELALREARQYGSTVLIEECLPGREVTVSVLGTRALPVVEIIPRHAWFDFAAKYTTGLTDYQVPADLPPAVCRAVQDAGLRAHRAVGCRHFSRADMILTEPSRPVVLEVNTIPGLTPTSLLPKAAASIGISYEDVCEQLVTMARTSSRQLTSV